MKKFIPLIALLALACITFMSCLRHDNDISITYNDEDEHYSMKASFSKRKVKAVERYMDRMLGDVTDMSFINSRINGKIALDDHTLFYIKKYPGHIKIRLNKYENTEEAYERIRAMCEGMKDVLIDKVVVARMQ
jgi:hypothetical protein